MKSLLIRVPENTSIDALPDDVVATIAKYHGQWMWVGKKVNGFGMLECLVDDSFVLSELGRVPSWKLLGLWQWRPEGGTPRAAFSDSSGKHWEAVNAVSNRLMPISADAIPLLPDKMSKGPGGGIVFTEATEWFEPISWWGWPERT